MPYETETFTRHETLEEDTKFMRKEQSIHEIEVSTVEKSGKIDQTVVNKALEPNYLKVL